MDKSSVLRLLVFSGDSVFVALVQLFTKRDQWAEFMKPAHPMFGQETHAAIVAQLPNNSTKRSYMISAT